MSDDQQKVTNTQTPDDNQIVAEPSAITPVVDPLASSANTDQANANAPAGMPEESAESKEDRIRRAKIAMEGLDRTVRRESVEKEERASEEKKKLTRLLQTIYHDKELLELTWVNLDDKRSGLKKLLQPIVAREEKIESEENQLESQEEVTLNPKEKHELEQKRWAAQNDRRKLEEEKWVIEEKILKIEGQIEANKKKYQGLLGKEDEVAAKIKEIDEQIIMQEEILRQQRELREETLRQEALKKIAAEKKTAEAEEKKRTELKKQEEEKSALLTERQKEQKEKEEMAAKAEAAKKRFEELKKQEEERQKQAAEAKKEEEMERAKILKEKIQTLARDNSGEKPEILQTAEEPAFAKLKTFTQPPIKNELEKQADIKRAIEVEKIKQENEEALMEEAGRRFAQQDAKTETLIDKLKNDDSGLKPLRTFQSDMAKAKESSN